MSKWKHFERSEFDCKETGENEMKDIFITRLDILRDECGFPFKITSGYRSPSHSIEAAKPAPGTHAQGIAADIIANGAQKFVIVKHAMSRGFTGIGIGDDFIHLDTRDGTPVIWNY